MTCFRKATGFILPLTWTRRRPHPRPSPPGWLKALVGGRDYGRSQLNHVLAKRQPGSSFKPFVYAAALTSAVDGSQTLITPATTLTDEPTTFQFGDTPY